MLHKTYIKQIHGHIYTKIQQTCCESKLSWEKTKL